MAEIIKINENTWRIEDMGVRFFLLEGSKKALLIDSGMNTPNAKEIAEGITKLPLSLLNTHADPDHTSGNDSFEEFYMSPEEEGNLTDHGKKGRILPVKTGDVIDLGDRGLLIIDLPGHTPGSIAVLDQKNRVLISGDVISDSNIYMFGKRRNLPLYLKSFQNLTPYLEQFDIIYPSHGTFPMGKEQIEKLQNYAKSILAGEGESSIVDLWGNQVRLYKFETAGFLCEV